MATHTPGFVRLVMWDEESEEGMVRMGLETEESESFTVSTWMPSPNEATAREFVRRWNEIERQNHNVTE